MSDWVGFNSTSLIRARYRPENSSLEVEFHGGRVYEYFDVPESVFQALIASDSAGKFFAENIKGVFRYARL